MTLCDMSWHVQCRQKLRLVLSGALRHHPRLKIVIGYMVEALSFMLARIDETTTVKTTASPRSSCEANNPRSGEDHGQRIPLPLMGASMALAVGRIMLPVDYHFATNARARAFLGAVPISLAEQAKIAHRHADRWLWWAS
jgi:hypothetical protein